MKDDEKPLGQKDCKNATVTGLLTVRCDMRIKDNPMRGGHYANAQPHPPQARSRIMILPKDNDRSWSKAMWKYLQRLDRCTRRVMTNKLDKYFSDMVIFGQGQYEVTQADMQSISDLMKGKRP